MNSRLEVDLKEYNEQTTQGEDKYGKRTDEKEDRRNSRK